MATPAVFKEPQLLKIFRYITSEAFADLTAILTLYLLPKDYLLSFSRGELNFNAEETDKRQRPDYYAEGQFWQTWSGDVVRTLPLEFKLNTAEGMLAIQIYGYTTGIRNCNDNISGYRSIYNYAAGIEDFVNTELDFFNDRMIWDLMLRYLDECAESYVTILLSGENLWNSKKELEKMYKTIACGSPISIVQEIEEFLEKYEFQEILRIKNQKE